MQALVAELRKKKRAETNSSRATAKPRRRGGNTANLSRHVPAEVRRQVWTRDDARCGYVDDEGRRCAETARLELHHSVPYANGGAHIAENLGLRCISHNALAAEQDFGREHMARSRGELTEMEPRWRGPFRDSGRIVSDAVRFPHEPGG